MALARRYIPTGRDYPAGLGLREEERIQDPWLVAVAHPGLTFEQALEQDRARWRHDPAAYRRQIDRLLADTRARNQAYVEIMGGAPDATYR